MKNLLIVFSFSLMFVGIANASQWSKNVLESVAKADTANCARYPEVSNLDEQFLCEGLLFKVSNYLYGNWMDGSNKDDKVKVINEWWESNGDTSLKNPLVRLHLAALIGQSKLNNTEEQREYVQRFLLSDNELIQGAALTAVGWVGECDDLKTLVLILESEREGIAEKAVLALLRLLGPDKSAKVLTKITDNLQRNSLKHFIRKQLSVFVQ